MQSLENSDLVAQEGKIAGDSKTKDSPVIDYKDRPPDNSGAGK